MPPTSSKPKSVQFDTRLTAFGNNTGIVVARALIDKLGAGQRPAVMVDVNGHQFRNTVGVMGGKHIISVSAAVRAATGLKGGDDVRVKLTVAAEPRTFVVPSDLERAFKSNKQARSFFDTLPNSLQRYHVDNINGAKTDETRRRRVDKAIELFLAGKKR
jgi:hypothetical protein